MSFSTNIYGQKASKSLFGEYEDTLKFLHNKIVFAQDDDAKLNFSNSFKNILKFSIWFLDSNFIFFDEKINFMSWVGILIVCLTSFLVQKK